jgi:hypothetical protein
VTTFDALIPKSLLALYSKLRGGQCLTHVDTEGVEQGAEAHRAEQTSPGLSVILKESVLGSGSVGSVSGFAFGHHSFQGERKPPEGRRLPKKTTQRFST